MKRIFMSIVLLGTLLTSCNRLHQVHSTSQMEATRSRSGKWSLCKMLTAAFIFIPTFIQASLAVDPSENVKITSVNEPPIDLFANAMNDDGIIVGSQIRSRGDSRTLKVVYLPSKRRSHQFVRIMGGDDDEYGHVYVSNGVFYISNGFKGLPIGLNSVEGIQSSNEDEDEG